MHSAGSRRLSTNEKMNRLINDRPVSTDADMSRERNAEKAAKNRLRRGALYGAGARALIPKVKVKHYITWMSLLASVILIVDTRRNPPLPLARLSCC